MGRHYNRVRRSRPITPVINKILYATDLSKNSLFAFTYAVSLARCFKASITVLHVIEPVHGTFGPEVKKMKEEEEEQSAIREIRERWRRFCEVVDRETACLGYISDIVVKSGQPEEEILKTAEEEACDILVLGAHAKGFIKQALLGSVSRKVLDRALKPVVVIPLPADNVPWDTTSF